MVIPTEADAQGADAASREIRVFISSTFRDFNEERYLLATQVFPELNERAKERGVELVEVDLRWGVTEEEAEVGHALEICLQEIENCKPYFIGMLGESYGTLTPPQREILKVSPGLLNKRQWLNGKLGQASYTELEIQHCLELLSEQEMKGRAFFYFRDSAYSELKASKGEEGWISKDPDDRRRLEELRRKICGSCHPLVGQGLDSPQAIATRIKQDLWALIDQQFPAGVQPGEAEKEARMHKAYGDDRRKLYLGGQAMLAKLEKAINDEQGLILVTGESGFGKSSLVANWQELHRKSADSDVILCHHLGCGNQAGEAANVVKRFLRFSEQFLLSHGTHTDEALGALPTDWWSLVSLANQRLNDLSVVATEGGFRFIWIIDSLDRLPEDSHTSLPWIPATPPPHVHIVVASLPCAALRVLLERKYRRIRIQELTTEEKENIIDKNLRRYSRSLDRNLKEKIIEHYLSHSPLFLRVLLDELRKTATFDGLESELNTYLAADSVPEFYEKILTRLERDFAASDVRSFLTAIWASRTGLNETDLLEVTGLAPLKLFGIRLSLGDSLINSAGRLVFAHDYVKGAIESRYLKSDLDKCAAHEILFNWQSTKTQWDQRKVEELPWQAVRAGRNEVFESLFLDAYISSRLIESWGAHPIYKLLFTSIPNHYQEIIASLADAALSHLDTHKSDNISELSRIADLVSDFLEEAQICKEHYLAMRRFVFRATRLEAADHPVNKAVRLRRLMDAYFWTGRYRHYYRSAQLLHMHACSRHGESSLPALTALAPLANAQYLCAKYTDLLALMNQWLPVANAVLGDAHPSFLTLIAIYGRISLDLGEYSRAIGLLCYAAEGFHSCSGPNYWRTVENLNQIGLAIREARYSNWHLDSPAITRDCVARLMRSYPENHCHLLAVTHGAKNDQQEDIFDDNSIAALMRFRLLADEGNLGAIKKRYKNYIDSNLPRIDWFLLEAYSQEAVWLAEQGKPQRAFTLLSPELLLECINLLSSKKPTPPSECLQKLDLKISTNLCKIPGLGGVAHFTSEPFADRKHQAAYQVINIFGNLTSTGIDHAAPDFHLFATAGWGLGYPLEYWGNKGYLPPDPEIFHSNFWREDLEQLPDLPTESSFAMQFAFAYVRDMDIESIGDNMLLHRMLSLPPEDFLVGQALTLSAFIKICVGKREAAIPLLRQLIIHRIRYSSQCKWAVSSSIDALLQKPGISEALMADLINLGHEDTGTLSDE